MTNMRIDVNTPNTPPSSLNLEEKEDKGLKQIVDQVRS